MDRICGLQGTSPGWLRIVLSEKGRWGWTGFGKGSAGCGGYRRAQANTGTNF